MTEGEADPFAADGGLARHAVDVVPLTRPAHHEQASMLDVERPVRCQSGTPPLQHELACRAERQRGDDRIEPELGRDPGGEVVEPRATSELDPARHQAIIRVSMSDAKRRLPIAITGATLIDGTRRPPLANATIVITGDRIARVGPAYDTPAPDDAEIIDGRI